MGEVSSAWKHEYADMHERGPWHLGCQSVNIAVIDGLAQRRAETMVLKPK